ncbi:MAG: alpha/beta fold hydrolase [Colwellia sp.]|nr:alpha/beta fold hydrolase [Colwellia sp.]
MTKADPHKFTTEDQLASRYTAEIADFWQQGEFSHFNGINNTRINYATFTHNKVHHDPHQESTSHQNSDNKCLVISSGRSETYLKYKELSFDLFKLGFNVFLLDHRGQGLSERALDNAHKGYVENFQYYVDDLATFIEHIVNPHCLVDGKVHKPYLLAHSMGGAIAARYLQDYPNHIQAAVLSSPMLGFNGSGIPNFISESIIKSTARLNHWFSKSPWYFFGHKDYIHSTFVDNLLMQSALRYQLFSQLYQDTPAIQLGGITVKWLTTSITALETIFTNINQITTPTLVLQSGADKIVSNQAQDDFCQQLHQLQPQSCPKGKPLVIKDAYHELFFESDKYRQQALTAVLAWFEQH